MKIAAQYFLKLVIAAAFVAGFLAPEIRAQRINLEKIKEVLEQSDCGSVSAGKIKICKYDFKFENKAVEAIVVRPAADGKYPSLMLLPGFDRTALDLIPYGAMFAHEGFASVAITPPGFGKSEGARDFVGAATQKVYAALWRRFRQESFVDAGRMGIFGHSRGGMAASLLAVELADAKAAVVASGIYDFKKAFEEIGLKGMREKMLEETDLSDEAVKARSSVLKMEKLNVPLLILHGEKDEKTLVDQAYLLRDKLTLLKKDFEIKIFADAGHELDKNEVVRLAGDFFRRRMKITAESVKVKP